MGRWPDARVAEEVEGHVRARPLISREEWYIRYWLPLSIPKPIVDFLFVRLPDYCGLESSRVLPSDRLTEDLRFDRICFPDWDGDLRDDFKREYGVDIFKIPELEGVHTLEDLARVLAHCAGLSG